MKVYSMAHYKKIFLLASSLLLTGQGLAQAQMTQTQTQAKQPMVQAKPTPSPAINGVLPQYATTDILLGQVLPLSGTNQSVGKDISYGYGMQFRKVNEEGGIYGRKIKVLELDDGSKDAQTTAAGVNELIQKYQVMAVLGTVGSRNTRATLAVIDKEKVPFIAPFTGDVEVNRRYDKYVFFTQPDWAEQSKAMAEFINQAGWKNVSILYQNDVVEAKNEQLVYNEFKKENVSIVGVERFDPTNNSSINTAIERVAKNSSEVLVILSNPQAASVIANKAMDKNKYIHIMIIPTFGLTEIIKNLDSNGHGVIFAQTMPNIRKDEVDVSVEYKAMLAKYYPQMQPSFDGLQAYINAKVVTEALRKVGANPTREKLIESLESMAQYNVGGSIIHFSPTNHEGQNEVELIMVGRKPGTAIFDNFVR